MSIFSTFLELHFCGLKSILFYPEYQKIFLYDVFAKKKHIRKRSIFSQQPWTNPFPKCRFFLEFLRTFLLWSKKHSFLSRITKNISFWLSLLNRTDEKKVDFLKKPWTNPFAKCRYFLTLLKLHFSDLKSILFYQEYKKNVSFWLLLLKKQTYEKRPIF